MQNLFKNLSPDEIKSCGRFIYDTMLQQAPSLNPLTGGNFTGLSTDDLRLMYNLYDKVFFNNALGQVLGGRIRFSLSKRMTRCAGKTMYWRKTGRFEIRFSWYLLVHNFLNDTDVEIVNGLECHDRLESLMRVMEHELVHVLEFLCWGSSACGRLRFKNIAAGLFGHTHHRHRLLTPAARMITQIKVNAGDTVSFKHKGLTRQGQVTRVTKRATVLVPDRLGGFKDTLGNRCTKFYVPLGLLQPVKE